MLIRSPHPLRAGPTALARARVVTLFAILLSIVGCATNARPKPDWTTAPDADIPGLSTFALPDAAGGRPRTLLDSRVRKALHAELLSKGYVESPDAPDFVVSYETNTYETTQSANPVSIGIGIGSWGGNVGGSVGTSVGVGGAEDLRLQNRVTIRAVDPEGARELWIGTTTTFEQPAAAAVVDQAVAGVMKGFPARRN